MQVKNHEEKRLFFGTGKKGMRFLADDYDWIEMKKARRLMQKLNFMDRCDLKE